jgi:hypothetical protein
MAKESRSTAKPATVPSFDELMWPALQALKTMGGSATNEEILAKIIELEPIPLVSVRKLPLSIQRAVPSSSFPRKRESRRAAPSRGGLDPRFRGGDAIALKILESFSNGLLESDSNRAPNDDKPLKRLD